MYRGNTGQGGLSGIIAYHDEKLVSVVRENVLPGRKLVVVSPHTNKNYCWPEFFKSITRLPLDDAHVVLYDNSQDPKVSAKLLRLANDCRSSTLIRDLNTPLIIENVQDNLKLMKRCSAVYEQLYSMIPKTAASLIVNHEDDIQVSAAGVERMLANFSRYSEIQTAVTDCRCRRERLLGGEKSAPIICNFHEVNRIGGGIETRYEFERCKPKAFGIEAVGGAHMGFWITRRECLAEVGMKSVSIDEMEMGHDFQYGLRVNQAGGVFAVDWSVRAKHYCMIDGRKVAI